MKAQCLTFLSIRPADKPRLIKRAKQKGLGRSAGPFFAARWSASLQAMPSPAQGLPKAPGFPHCPGTRPYPLIHGLVAAGLCVHRGNAAIVGRYNAVAAQGTAAAGGCVARAVPPVREPVHVFRSGQPRSVRPERYPAPGAQCLSPALARRNDGSVLPDAATASNFPAPDTQCLSPALARRGVGRCLPDAVGHVPCVAGISGRGHAVSFAGFSPAQCWKLTPRCRKPRAVRRSQAGGN